MNEVGIEFPLSMVGGHSYINDKFKDTRTFFNDSNFHKLIMYGLLSKIIIGEDEYNIALSKNNTVGKINLKGSFGKSEDTPKNNYTSKIGLLNKIEKLLTEIESGKKGSTNGIKSVSLFFISDVFKDIQNTGFHFDKDENFIFNIEKKNYQIISVIPKYSYERGNLSYILQSLNKDNENYKNYINKKDFLDVARFKVPNNFDAVLLDLEHKYKERYKYVEIKDVENPSDIKRITKNDLLILSKDLTDNKVCIISYKISEKPLFKVFFQVYKLNINNAIDESFFEKSKKYFDSYDCLIDIGYNLEIEEIKNSGIVSNINMSYLDNGTKKVFNSEINKTYYRGDDGDVLEVNGNLSEVEGRIYKGFSYDLNLYDSQEGYIIDKSLKREDLYTLFLSKVLNFSNNDKKYYFSGKKTQGIKKGEKFLELADMVGLYTDKTGKTNKSVIELYHMKISPFDSDYDSKHIKGGFSYYTDVLGQILQKVTGIIYEDDIDKIKDNIDKYKNTYYKLIFKEIQKLIRKSTKSIKFDFIFPVRYQDYFGNDKMVKEINWTSLKVIYDIFKSNTDNIAFPNNIDFSIDLSMLLVKKSGNNYEFKKISIGDFFSLNY